MAKSTEILPKNRDSNEINLGNSRFDHYLEIASRENESSAPEVAPAANEPVSAADESAPYEKKEPILAPTDPEIAPEEQKREFNVDGSEYVEFTEVSSRPERTAAEEKSLLKSLLEKFTGAKEAVSERFAKSKDYLNERAKHLDSQAVGMSKGERVLRWMGDQYNKRSLREKFGIGLVIAGGAIATGGASIYLPYAFAGALGVQRAFGMAGMFLQQEKTLQEKKVGETGQVMSMKERAAVTATIWSLGLGYALKEGIDLAHEYNVAERMREWLSGIMGYESMPKVTESVSVRPQVAPPPAEAPTSSAAPTIPNIEVTASAGHGYEYMAKRVWEGLQELKGQGHDVGQFSPDSDIYKLAHADATNIDKIVHEIAASHQAYAEAGGANLRIDLGSHLSFNAEGQLEMTTPGGETFVNAPESAAVTPPYSAEPVPVRPPPAEVREMFGHADTQDSSVQAEEVIPAATPESPTVTEPLSQGTVEQPQTFKRVEAQPGDATILGQLETSASNIQPESSVSTVQPEATPLTEVMRNQFGLEIPAGQSHIYAGEGNRLFVFGGSPENQAKVIGDFFASPDNAKSVIYGTSTDGKFRIPWFKGPEGITPGLPERTSGFLGFGSSWMKPPSLDDLRKLIK